MTLGDLYLDNRPIAPRDLQDAIRRATIARTFFGVIPGLGIAAALLAVVGFVIEYVAWTTGLGALALTRLAPMPPAPASNPPTL